MAEFINLQSDFTLGQLNEKLAARVNFEGYYKGVRKIRNMVVTPEGGLLKRFGLKFSTPLKDVASDITSENSQYIILEMTATEKLVVVFSPEKVTILTPDAEGIMKPPFIELTSVYTSLQIKDLRFTQSRGVLLIFHEDVVTYRLLRVGTPIATFNLDTVIFKHVPVFGFNENDINDLTFDVDNPNTVRRDATLTLSPTTGFLFTKEFFGGLFVSEGGIMRFHEPLGGIPLGSTIGGTITTKFAIDHKNIPGTEAFVSQQAINDKRGWPKDGVFFSGRLWLLGTKALPNAIFSSAVQDFFNFSTATQNAGDPIDDILQTESLTFVKGGIGNKSLIIFTNDGPFATQLPLEGALTPTNTGFSVQGGQTINNLPPLTLDDKVIFVNNGGKIVWGMSYSEELRGYSTVNLSITGSDVIRNPVSTAVFKADPKNNTSYAFFVNDDGTMAVYTSDSEAQVNGWTLIETDGLFKEVFSLSEFGYVVVERFGELFIEKIEFNNFMDSFVDYTFPVPGNVLLSGLDHLEGQFVEVIADNLLQPIDKTNPGQPGSSIVKNGQIRLKKSATTAQVGLPFSVEVVPMPLNVKTANGDDLFLPKTPKNVTVSFFDSLGILVNDFLIGSLEFSPDGFFNIADVQTGDQKVNLSVGSIPTDVHVQVTQTRPLPCYIRAISLQVEI